MLIILCLGACFVWAFREIDEMRERQQRRRELVREARRTVGSGH
jgi:hypothetical protein